VAKDLIRVGATAPDFSLATGDGRTVRLSDILTSHHAILYFVREYT